MLLNNLFFLRIIFITKKILQEIESINISRYITF